MIEVLRNDVEKLISAYERTLAEKKRLSEELSKCRDENKTNKEQIAELERRLDNLRLKEAFKSSQGDEQAKAKLDGIIREIDKCISLLKG